MARNFGDADSVRRLGQALLATGRGAAGATSNLSGQVRSLVPSAWSGDSAEAFSSDWNRKAAQARQLAAVCTHAGQVLVELAGELDAAGQRAASALRFAGGPTGARFGDPVSGQRAEQMLSQASGAAEQARAAARSKLAGIQVPRIGAPLTVSQVDAWASGLVPGRVPVFNRLFGTLLGDVKDFARRTGLATAWGVAEQKRVSGLMTIGQEVHFAEGIVDGLTGMLRGVGDFLPGPDGGLGRWLWGDASASQSLEGLSHLAAPFLGMYDPASPSAMEGFGKGLVAWDEWHTDPSRAAGNVFFNVASLFAGTKLLSLKPGVAAETAGATDAGDAVEGAARDGPGQPPGPPPASFGKGDHPEVGGDRLDLPPDKAEQLEYGEPLTPHGESVPFFDGTPVPEQAVQQDLGDCGLVATLRAVARYRPETLREVIRAAPDGRVILRLHKVTLSGWEAVPSGETIEMPISREVPTWKGSGTELGIPASKASWAAMIEKALAAIDKRWTAGRIKLNDDIWRQQAKLRGLRNEDEIKALVGARGYARLGRALTHLETAELMAELTGERVGIFSLRSKYVESALSRLVQERKPIIVASKAENERAGLSDYGVVPGHAYEVTGVEDGKIIMKNPWGYRDPAPVPAGKFLKEFQNLIVTFG